MYAKKLLSLDTRYLEQPILTQMICMQYIDYVSHHRSNKDITNQTKPYILLEEPIFHLSLYNPNMIKLELDLNHIWHLVIFDP